MQNLSPQRGLRERNGRRVGNLPLKRYAPWRVPFLLSALLVGVRLFIRLRIAETPAFNRVQESGTAASLPLLDAIRTHPRNILLAMGARLAENGVFYLYSVFVLVYVTEQLKLPRALVLNGVLLATVCELVAIPAFGALSG